MSFEEYEENILKKETEEIIIYRFFCNYLERPYITHESKKTLINDLNQAFADHKKRNRNTKGNNNNE